MTERRVSLDELPTSRFHRRVALVAAGGPFCDGYLLGIIVVALPLIARDLHLSAAQSGLIGASSLLGMFIGGIVFGPMTDRFGRQSMYVLNLAVFVLCSIAHLFVTGAAALFALRLVMGIALGADYPIATALASEFLPRRLRGPVLSSLVLCLWVGYTLSLATGLFVHTDDSSTWRYVLASAAIPSAIFLVLRLNVPESPRWLVSVGRIEQARRIVETHLGRQADLDHLLTHTSRSAPRTGLGLSSIRELFARGYGRMVFFCSVFWTCQIAPSFAIKTFQPLLLKSVGVTHVLGGTLVIISFAIVGTALGMLVINRIGRRPLLIASGTIATLSLFALATPLSALAVFAIALFILFTIAEAAGSALQFVYPNEVFPTDVRATGMGLAMSVSRIGAAAGTFVLPITIAKWGAANGLLIAAGIAALGLLVSYRMAPETRNLPLADSEPPQAREKLSPVSNNEVRT
jgi:putative MFS transporter